MNLNPFPAIRRCFPFTLDGRSTLVYLSFAGAGPALTAVLIWSMRVIRDWRDASVVTRLDRFASLAMVIAYAMMLIVVSLACFVSIRAIKVNLKDGTADFNSRDDPGVIKDGDSVTVTKDGGDGAA